VAKNLGQALREARLERGIDLTEVERVTKIRVKFLRAMEEDSWGDLPPPAYARSFLQTYARYLGLDDEALVEQYREDIEPAEEEPIPSGIIRSGTLQPPRSLRPIAFVVGGVGAAAAIALIVAAIGSSGGSDNGGSAQQTGKHRKQGTSRTGSTTSATATATTPASELSLQLTATADVWVCLVDDRGTSLVNGLILTTGQSEGPFTANGFEARFGNGSVQMTVNSQPSPIPQSSSPVDYRITSSGAKQLASGAGPTCA
jgi:cytoskeletal protein RodZ